MRRTVIALLALAASGCSAAERHLEISFPEGERWRMEWDELFVSQSDELGRVDTKRHWKFDVTVTPASESMAELSVDVADRGGSFSRTEWPPGGGPEASSVTWTSEEDPNTIDWGDLEDLRSFHNVRDTLHFTREGLPSSVEWVGGHFVRGGFGRTISECGPEPRHVDRAGHEHLLRPHNTEPGSATDTSKGRRDLLLTGAVLQALSFSPLRATADLRPLVVATFKFLHTWDRDPYLLIPARTSSS